MEIKCDICGNYAIVRRMTALGPLANLCNRCYKEEFGTELWPEQRSMISLKTRQSVTASSNKCITMNKIQKLVAIMEGLWHFRCPYCNALTPADADASCVKCLNCINNVDIINPYF
jgi:hypothetical protein